MVALSLPLLLLEIGQAAVSRLVVMFSNANQSIFLYSSELVT
jgi:hypothetical protein